MVTMITILKVIVLAAKASNNIVFVCKTYYILSIVKELGINNNTGNPTYTPTSLSKEEILYNHKSVILFLCYLLKMLTLSYPLYIGYLSCISVRTLKGTLQDPPCYCRSSDHCTFHSQKWTPVLL